MIYWSNSALSKCWLNTYRQWFGHSDVDGAVAGGLEDVHGIIQAGSLQVSLVNEHEAITGQQATISVGHASRHQGPDDQHRLRGVLRVLPLENSAGVDQCLSSESQEPHCSQEFIAHLFYKLYCTKLSFHRVYTYIYRHGWMEHLGCNPPVEKQRFI